MSEHQIPKSGKYVIQCADGALEEALSLIKQITGMEEGIRMAKGMVSTMSDEQIQGRDITVLQSLETVIVEREISQEQFDQISALTGSANSPVLSIVEDQEEYFSLDPVGEEILLSRQRLEGMQEGISMFTSHLLSRNGVVAQEFSLSLSSGVTWGLEATRVNTSSLTGKGIKVAVLDTGFDLSHPDFQGRTIVTKRFATTGSTQNRTLLPITDVDGHGTHVAGTACGPIKPLGPTNPLFAKDKARYGVASEADLFVGKVLNDQGRAFFGEILKGMEWAIDEGCEIINMSLGGGTSSNFSYERLGKKALDRGSLIIAAAGNSAQRSKGFFGAVLAPANSPSIMAVAAIDENGKIANFSDRSQSFVGSEIDIAAPGVDVYSSFPHPRAFDGYFTMSGTSMAAPHVAGIAALYAQANPSARGKDLWDLVVSKAKPLSTQDRRDVGAGLVQAP